MGFGGSDGSVDSGGHYKLSKNIWFMWSKMSYSGQKAGRTTDGQRNVKIELEFWILNLQLK